MENESLGRYLVFAFYDHLGFKFRTTDHESKNQAFDYIGGLRTCETPYIAFDMKKGCIFDFKESEKYTIKEMIKIMKKEWEM